MKFQLKEAKRNRINCTYHIVDEEQSIVGSINVKVEQAGDLLNHWVGGAEVKNNASQNKNLSAQQSLAAAFMKARTKFSPQQVLRGCHG